jgi:hypothetical protein
MHALIVPILTGERALAIKHIDFLSQRCFDKGIVLFDRGYASFELFKYCLKMNTRFLMRLRKKFDKEIDKLPCGIHKYKLKRFGEGIVLQAVKLNLLTNL